MKVWLQLGAVTVVAGWLLAAHSTAGTSEVFQLQTTIKGVWNTNGAPAKVTAEQLIKLALGVNTVPANWRLGLVTQCASNDMRIIVYDGTTNLWTLGNLKTVSVVESLRGRRYTRNVISAVMFNFKQTNELPDGNFFVAGSILSDSNRCFISYHANIRGYLTLSNSIMNVANTALSAGGTTLGTLIEP